MPATFLIRARLVLLKPLPAPARAALLEQFSQAVILDEALSIELRVPAHDQNEATAEAMAHLYAALGSAGLQDDEDYALESLGSEPE